MRIQFRSSYMGPRDYGVYAPRSGAKGIYREPGRPDLPFRVVRVEGDLCYARYGDDEEAQPFIWRFKDGFNKLHSWPGKPENMEAK